MKKVSVIIPVYNASASINQCVNSILEQSYRNFEVLLIDDGSTDNSLEICQNLSSLDNRIKVYHQSNKGPSAARNLGLRYSSGDYITFIDSDDYIATTFLECMLKELNDTVKIAFCGSVYFNDNASTKQQLVTENDIVNSKEDYLVYLQKNWAPWAKMFDKSLINGLLFDENLSIAEDLDFNINIILKNAPFFISVIADNLYYYKENQGISSKLSYDESFYNGFKVEYEIYNKLKTSEMKKYLSIIFKNGLVSFYTRLSSLPFFNIFSHKGYKNSRTIIKENKKYLLEKNYSNRNVLFLIVYFPCVYFLLKKIIK